MQPVKYYVPERPVIPPLLTALIGIVGIVLFIISQDTYYFTLIYSYVVILPVFIISFVLTSILYKLQTGKSVVTAKYFFALLLYNTIGIGGIISYFFITINYKNAGNPKIMQLPVVEQYKWQYKGNTNFYVVVGYKGQTTRLKIDKLPSPPAKTATVQLARGYFGYAVIEKYKVDN